MAGEAASAAGTSPRADAEQGFHHERDGSSERTPLLNNKTSSNRTAPQAENPQEEETTILAEDVSTAKLVVILGSAYCGVFLGSIDSTIIATLSAPIASDFNSLSLLSWLATAYLIANAACQPLSGRLTDIFGRGAGLVFSNVFFAAGNLICGLAEDQYVMILGRVVAGIGGGGMMSISSYLASDLIPLRQRGLVQGIGNICYGSGAMLGGIFGGVINDHTKLGWRLAFLIQVPPPVILAVIQAILIRVPPKQSDKSYLARIDFGGAFFTLSFLVLLLLGLNTGGNIVPWISPLPLTTIPLSIVALACFLWWESKARQPIIPVRLLAMRTPLTACLCNLFTTMTVMCGIFYVPLYLQVLGNTATMAGLKLLPAPLGTAVGSIMSGWIMKKTGKYIKLGIIGLLIMITGVVMFVMQDETTPAWLPIVAFFLVGYGYASMLTITLLACIAAVDHSQQAVITAATYLARSLGGTIGITIGSAVYQNILKARLWDRFGDEPNAAEEIRRIRDDISALKHLPEGWYDGVIKCFVEAFRGVFSTLLVISFLGLLCTALMKQHTLHTTLERR